MSILTLACGIDNRAVTLAADGGAAGGLNAAGGAGSSSPSQSGTGGGSLSDGNAASDGPGSSGTPESGGMAGSSGVADASLAIDPPAADFHTVVTATTASAVFRVENHGGLPTAVPTVQLTGVDASQFSIATNNCTASISPGSQCALTIQFRPTGTGMKLATMFVSAGPGAAATATLSGTGVAPGALSIDKSFQDFGSLLPGVTSSPIRFTVSNVGSAATGALSTEIAGSADFVVVNDGCAGVSLLPTGSCTIDVTLTPAAAGAENASLQITASTAGTISASLSGQGLSPALLTIDAASPFLQTVVGTTSVSQTLRVTNAGDVAAGTTSPPAATITGANAADFTIKSNTCTGSLAAHASCAVGVVFAPAAVGMRTATLGVSAVPGGSATASLAGTSQGRPASLSGSATTHDFGSAEVGVATTSFTWTITNTGDVASAIPTVTNGDPTDFAMTNNCTAALAGGRTCTVVVTFRATAGMHTGVVSLSASPGGTTSLTVSGTGLYRVTMTTAGTGTVTSSPAGISCPPACSALLPTTATLQARPTNGSGFFFSGWTGGGCTGPSRDCAVTLTAPLSVTATFSRMTANLIFVTSSLFPANRGGAAAYDQPCNAVATAAGINNAGGTGYIAVMSDGTTPFRARLGTSARGWMRMDGKPFADTVDSLFTTHQVFNAVNFLETGQAAPPTDPVATGTQLDGTLGAVTQLNGDLVPGSCADWTGGGQGLGAYASGGPRTWVEAVVLNCTDPAGNRLLCMGITSNTPVTPIVTAGRKIWISHGFLPNGAETPDARCQAERPAGVTTAAALIAHPARAASAVLSSAMSYVRPDGTLVGTGADLAAGRVASGIWQFFDGYGDNFNVFTGQTTLTAVGTAASTCSDWTDTTGQATVGITSTVTSLWWWIGFGSQSCGFTMPIYCVQTAP